MFTVCWIMLSSQKQVEPQVSQVNDINDVTQQPSETTSDFIPLFTISTSDIQTSSDDPSLATILNDNKRSDEFGSSIKTPNDNNTTAILTDDKATSEEIDQLMTTPLDDNKLLQGLNYSAEMSIDLSSYTSDVLSSTSPIRANTTADEFSTTDIINDANATLKVVATGVISTYISYVITPLFLVTGFLGNSLTVAVMAGRSFSSMTMSIILIALAVSDTAFLFMHLFMKLWFIKLLGQDIRAFSDASCRLFFVFFRTSKLCCSWFVVLVCLERLIAVYFPMKSRVINTKRNVMLSLVVIIATMLVYTGFWTYSSSIVVNNFCVSANSDPAFAKIQRSFSQIGTLIYAGIPTVLLLIMTPAIIVRILQQSKTRMDLASVRTRKFDQNQKTVAMLLGVVIAFILLATPIAVVFNITNAQGKNLFISTDPVLSVVREVAQILELLNYCINFFLYVACSTSFRARIADIFRCKTATRIPSLFELTSTSRDR